MSECSLPDYLRTCGVRLRVSTASQRVRMAVGLAPNCLLMPLLRLLRDIASYSVGFETWQMAVCILAAFAR